MRARTAPQRASFEAECERTFVTSVNAQTMSGRAITSGLSRWALIWYPEGPEPRHRSAVRLPSESIGCSGRVKWPWTQIHYVQVSAGGCYSLIPYTFQMNVEARTPNSAALFAGT